MNISFNGKVFLSGSTKHLSKSAEVGYMRAYADKNGCDVIVLNRDYYMDDTGKYDTLIVKENETTGTNNIFTKIFDFKAKEPDKSQQKKLDIPFA